MLSDEFDPWEDSTPMVDPVRDDPFGEWPIDSTIGEVTGPFSYQSLVTRAALGGALRTRRRPARLMALLWVAVCVGVLALELAARA